MVTADTTADGYPLSGLAAIIKQNLKQSILGLFKLLQQQQEQALTLLFDSDTDFWQLVCMQLEQEGRTFMRNRLLRNAFLHAVLIQLEAICWRHDVYAADSFCFLQKQQVS